MSAPVDRPAQRSPPAPPRVLVAVGVAALLTHVVALGHGFVWLDHGDLVARGALAPPAEWPSLFLRGYARTGFYRPLVALLFSAEALFGEVWLHHAVNVLLHALCALGVAAVGARAGLSARAAGLAGLFFALHPAATPVASLLPYRPELLLVLFLLLSLWGLQTQRPWAVGLGLLLGGLSKETALVFTPLALGLVLWERRERPGLRLLGAAALGWGLALGLRLLFAPPWRAAAYPLALSEAWGTRLGALGRSLLRLFVPVDPGFCDAVPILSLWHPWALAGFVAALGVAALAVRERGPLRLFVLALLPSLGLVPVPRMWAPNYLYLPLVFLSLWVAATLAPFIGRRAVQAALLGGFALFASLSFADARRYRDDGSMFGPEVARRPWCREARFYLGEHHRAHGRLDAAGEAYEAALRAAPGYVSFVSADAAAQNLTGVRLEQGRLGDAEQAARKALSLPLSEPERRRATHNLAAVMARRGEWARVLEVLGPELSRPDALGESLLLAARAYHEQGQSVESERLLRRLGVKVGEEVEVPAHLNQR